MIFSFGNGLSAPIRLSVSPKAIRCQPPLPSPSPRCKLVFNSLNMSENRHSPPSFLHMSDKFFRFLEMYHRAYKWFMWVMILGSFLGIVIISTYAQGFPEGFLLGLLMGTIVAGFVWWRLSTSIKRAEAAREELRALATGQKQRQPTTRQETFALLGLFLTGLIALLLILSCMFYSCQTDYARVQIAFLLIGLSIVIDRVFREQRVKGQAALILFGGVMLITLAILGRILRFW